MNRTEATGEYDDIIHLPHHVSAKHPQMSVLNRAAQFSPFAALSGHEAMLQETARITDRRHEQDEAASAQLNRALSFLHSAEQSHPQVTVTYFQPDPTKAGGVYTTVCGQLKKIDLYTQSVLLESGVSIAITDIDSITYEQAEETDTEDW